MDAMSDENFKIIDENFDQVIERLSNLEKIVMAHLENHKRVVREGLGVSAEQFAALFAGEEPIDPERFRSDQDKHGV
jgi:hypothetical protein